MSDGYTVPVWWTVQTVQCSLPMSDDGVELEWENSECILLNINCEG